MEIILQLFQSLDLIVILTSIIVPPFVALLAVKRIEDEEITDWLARTVQAWCKIVLDISLVWGIALACTGLIGMTLNNDSSDSNKNWDTTSDTIALMVANKLNAKALLLVKSCSSPFEIKNYRLSQNDIERLVFLKILDKNFSSEFREGQMEVLIFFRDQVPDKLDY